MLQLSAITKCKTDGPPEHHILSAAPPQAASGWASYLPSWAPSPERTRPSLKESKIAGFRNPWPSWHKPTAAQMWESFQWGEDDDGCLEIAASHLTDNPSQNKPRRSKRPRFSDIHDWPNSPGAKAARLLRIDDPDFSFPPANAKAKVTWLGHASLLLQLPPPVPNSRPIRCLFDPIFSARCSPSQFVGPIRSYPPPCKPEDLPPIDVVCLSHNHLDHMDAASLTAIYQNNKDSVRFFVPLNNKKYLLSFDIPPDRIVEMDWWDSVQLTHPFSPGTTLKIHCTPAQHNSFRAANDTNTALWSSWYLEHLRPSHPAFRVFFAGDTGYQFHPSPSWPPPPPSSAQKQSTTTDNTSITPNSHNSDDETSEYPPCPAFSQIRTRLGAPHLLLLPVSVGATFAYLRSFVPLPDWCSPFPRHSEGVTGANHMGPWDAVRVLRVMTDARHDEEDGAAVGQAVGIGDGGNVGGKGYGGEEEGRKGNEGGGARGPVAVAMHWGTFVTDPGEVLKTLGGLEWACRSQGVRFGRGLEDVEPGAGKLNEQDGEGGGEKAVFVALNHGGSVCV